MIIGKEGSNSLSHFTFHLAHIICACSSKHLVHRSDLVVAQSVGIDFSDIKAGLLLAKFLNVIANKIEQVFACCITTEIPSLIPCCFPLIIVPAFELPQVIIWIISALRFMFIWLWIFYSLGNAPDFNSSSPTGRWCAWVYAEHHQHCLRTGAAFSSERSPLLARFPWSSSYKRIAFESPHL